MFRFFKICLIASIISGCSSNGPVEVSDSNDATGYEAVYSGLPMPFVFVASSIQWNEDYAVSAKHTPFLINVAYECSTGCDLVFIKRKAKGKIPEWRDSLPNENIISYGNSPAYLTVKAEGNMLKTKLEYITDNGAPREFYSLTNSPTLSGMSGGPVYAKSDNKVVGMTLGFVVKSSITQENFDRNPELINEDKITIILPTELIEKEWKLFQSRERKNLITQYP